MIVLKGASTYQQIAGVNVKNAKWVYFSKRTNKQAKCKRFKNNTKANKKKRFFYLSEFFR